MEDRAHVETARAAPGPLWDRLEGPQNAQTHLLPGLSGEFSFEQIASLIAELNVGQSFEVKRLEGFLIAVSKAVFQQVGGWDPAMEDDVSALDLCWRLRGAGFTLRVAADVIVRDTNATPTQVSAASAAELWRKVMTCFHPEPAPLPVEIWGVEVLGAVEEASADLSMSKPVAA
jgi:hypothetical protein